MRTFPKNHDHHQRHLGSHDKWIFKASRQHAVERKEINDFMAEERSHFKPATVSISVILHIECELRRHRRAKRQKKKEREMEWVLVLYVPRKRACLQWAMLLQQLFTKRWQQYKLTHRIHTASYVETYLQSTHTRVNTLHREFKIDVNGASPYLASERDRERKESERNSWDCFIV